MPHTSGIADPLQAIDLRNALQYGTAQGYPPLYSFIRQLTREHLHPNIPYEGGADVVLTVGSTDGFSKSIECLSNVWSEEKDWIREREGVLCEEFAYMNAIQQCRPSQSSSSSILLQSKSDIRPGGLQAVPVKIDLDGMLASGPGGLQDVLENWDVSKGKRPHLMYTVT